jgi:hypothetical protein
MNKVGRPPSGDGFCNGLELDDFALSSTTVTVPHSVSKKPSVIDRLRAKSNRPFIGRQSPVIDFKVVRRLLRGKPPFPDEPPSNGTKQSQPVPRNALQ